MYVYTYKAISTVQKMRSVSPILSVPVPQATTRLLPVTADELVFSKLLRTFLCLGVSFIVMILRFIHALPVSVPYYFYLLSLYNGECSIK
jgi:hypothetical protein